MTRNNLRSWIGGGVLVAGAPALSGCLCIGGGDCGKKTVTPWDGGFGDAGVYLADGGFTTDPAAFLLSDGGLNSEGCQHLCSNYSGLCTLADAGLVSCTIQCVGGRAPPGLHALSTVDSTASSWVARMAELEAAAVHAFSHLADELEVHGLRQHAAYALTAASQEVRHAHEVTRLALSLGRCPTPHPIEATPVRSLEDVAIDNAGEGCGREAIGALINAHQAKRATDPLVRKTMAGIAADERAHAEFSTELAQALMPKLTRAQRSRVREAQERTLAQLVGDEAPAAARATLGLMDQGQLQAAAQQLLEHARV